MKKHLNLSSGNLPSKPLFCTVILLALLNIYFLIFWQSTSTANQQIAEKLNTMELIIQQQELLLEACEAGKMSPEPSLEYETMRRRIRRNIQYQYQFLKFRLESLAKSDKFNDTTELTEILHSVQEYKISLLSDWNTLTKYDGFEKWREIEANRLSGILQKRFTYFMNPRNCSAAKYFICHGEWSCGWGCQLNQYMACFSLAYGMSRKLNFIKFNGQLYEIDEYQRYYEPISNTCNEQPKEVEVKWPGNENATILRCSEKIRGAGTRKKYMLFDLPDDLAPRMIKLFEEPNAWWSGQILKFILKFKESTQKAINDTISKIGYKHPIVGIHIRRGNKIKEAPYQPIGDYMAEANSFYDQLELTQKIDKRRIFLATDDPKIIEEIRENYPNYEVLVDEVTTSRAQSYVEPNKNSLDVLTNVWLLAQSDYFIGTFSSNVGRRVVEFRYEYFRDAMERTFSLDQRYFEFGEIRQMYRVVMQHKPQDSKEILADVGDILEAEMSGWVLNVQDQHGYMPLINKKTNAKGLIPTFKLEKLYVDNVDFPTFDIK